MIRSATALAIAALLAHAAGCGSTSSSMDDASAGAPDLWMGGAPDLRPPGPDLATCLGTAASCGAPGACVACPDDLNATGTCADGACGLACKPDATMCAGRCVDLMIDQRNCGGCNHDCFGGGCNAGACQPSVLTETLRCEGVAVDDSNLYFTDVGDGSVYRRPLAGGVGLVTVAPKQGEPSAVVVRAATLYWTDAAGGTINWSPVQNPQPAMLATGQARPNDLAVDDAAVYWVNSDDGTVRKVALGGGQPVTLASGQAAPVRIAIDGVNVYWTNQGDGTVMQAPKAGGQPVTVASGQARPYGVTVDATSVYWVNDGDGTVCKAPIGGGGPTTLAQGQSHPHSIAVDGTGLYWTNLADGHRGTVARLAPNAIAPTVIAAPPPDTAPAGIALDTGSIYFVDHASGIVWRLAK